MTDSRTWWCPASRDHAEVEFRRVHVFADVAIWITVVGLLAMFTVGLIARFAG